MNELEILQKIKSSYQKILGNKLVGIYVHGSIAFDCFNWNKSDIDFLVVVNEKLSQNEKESLISELLLLDADCPPKGLEMSVILKNVCKPFIYPTPFELHFSNMHKSNFRENLSETCRNMNGTDSDLAAHITVINKVGIVLCGDAVDQIFDFVPRQFYLESILSDIENADNEIEDDPIYFVLNLCRVLAYLESDLVLSKKQGGEWAKEKLPDRYASLVHEVLEAYKKDISLDNNDLLHPFADYMLKRIYSA